MDPATRDLPNEAPLRLQDRLASMAHTFNPQQLDLVNDIVRRYGALHQELCGLKRQLPEGGVTTSPRGKKRKLEPGQAVVGAAVKREDQDDNGHTTALGQPIFEEEGISFIAPARKKYKIGIVPSKEPGGQDGGLTTDGTLLIRWRDMEHVARVAVPDRAQPAHYFIITPSAQARRHTSIAEPIVLTMPDTTPHKGPHASGHEMKGQEHDNVFFSELDNQLRLIGRKVIEPDARDFKSEIGLAHRKGEKKTYHVKAFRGSKDGFLYFLPTGIMFGFKKPILFFPLHSIISTSFTSVLQRTFNLNISAQLSATDCTFCIPGAPATAAEGSTDVELEFSMLDQADFAGIDAYIKARGLHDASLAEARRAKKVDGDAKAATRPVGVAEGDEAGESELARAERELQDAEDEGEEDYEETGGESDGSGESSGEEDEEDEAGEVEVGEDEDDGMNDEDNAEEGPGR